MSTNFLSTYIIHIGPNHVLSEYWKKNEYSRVIYDRVRNRKNYFEIPAFLPIERGISRVGKFKVMLHFAGGFHRHIWEELRSWMWLGGKNTSLVADTQKNLHKSSSITATEMCLFVFLFSFEFPALEVPHSKFKKAAISQ